MGTGRGLALVVATAFVGITLGCGAARSTPGAAQLTPRQEGGELAGPDAVGSVAAIDGDELRATPGGRVEEALEGRFAGVHIIRHAGGGISIRIRGTASIMGDWEPLYVVDGMAVQAEPGRGLNWLNPRDIQRIEILKDAASTSMYGVRGANGVVIITTRRSARSSEGGR